MERVLFVCRRNIHRSKAAEIIFNHKAEQAGLDMRAESAGVRVSQPRLSSSHIVKALQRAGYSEATRTYSREVDSDLLLSAQLAFGIEDDQTDALFRNFPVLELNHLHALPRYVGRKIHVKDPEQIIRPSPLTWTSSFLPDSGATYWIKRHAGGIHPNDMQGVDRVFDETVRNLDLLITPLVDKLAHPSQTPTPSLVAR